MNRTAHCSCQNLKVTMNGDPKVVLICHCLDCQSRTGNIFGTSAYFDQNQLIQIEGETKCFKRQGESGHDIEFFFCPNCGSTVYWYAERLAGLISVAPGCFQDTEFPAPTRIVYNRSKHHWVDNPESGEVFEASSLGKKTFKKL